jgi:hypothetical protein
MIFVASQIPISYIFRALDIGNEFFEMMSTLEKLELNQTDIYKFLVSGFYNPDELSLKQILVIKPGLLWQYLSGHVTESIMQAIGQMDNENLDIYLIGFDDESLNQVSYETAELPQLNLK